MDLKIERYNPRRDKDDLMELVKGFNFRSLEPIDIDKFEKEIDSRVKDLKLRNSIVLAKEGSVLKGAGFFTVWKDFLGNEHCWIHDVVTSKEDSFKEGIEEMLIRELFTYLKRTMNIDKISLFIKKNDSKYQSVLMKLKVKENRDFKYYEHDL